MVLIAATNRADVLDPALLRPGRFDRQIVVDAPDVKGRERILNVHAKNKPLGSDVDLANVAKLTPGFSGADLANLHERGSASDGAPQQEDHHAARGQRVHGARYRRSRSARAA